MYEKAFMLEIVTPRKVVFKGEATSLSAPGTQGNFQVLYNHAPLLSSLEIGKLKVKDKQGMDSSYSTSGGFVEVKKNHVVVIVETAELAKEIDIGRAKSAKQRAEERLHLKQKDIDIERARLALLRSLNRLRIAGMS